MTGDLQRKICPNRQRRNLRKNAGEGKPLSGMVSSATGPIMERHNGSTKRKYV